MRRPGITPFVSDTPLASPPRPHYAEAPPSGALAAWVACYWSMSGEVVVPFTSRVLPDMCADIIVDVAASPNPFVVGAMRHALVVPHRGRVDLFGIRFRPGAAFQFLDLPLAELTDRRVALDGLWGRVADVLAEAVCSAPGSARVAAAERVLSDRLRVVRREEELATRAVALIRRARGSVGVRAAAAALGVGERRLERAFAQCVGLRPKELARVARFRVAIDCIDAGRMISWPDLACAAGYADQSHLIREFNALAGVTPAGYARESSPVGFVQYGRDLDR
jgi:AraC-like DNA-binding protein